MFRVTTRTRSRTLAAALHVVRPGFSGKWAPYYYTITTWQKLGTAPAIYNLVYAVGVGTFDGTTWAGCQSNP
jgi:hypothetical protein